MKQSIFIRALRAMLSVLESDTEESVVQPTAPAPVEESAETKLDRLLVDPRYNLRTLTALVEESGLYTETITRHVAQKSSKYITKHRSSDGAMLIGLRDKAGVAASLAPAPAVAVVEEPVASTENDDFEVTLNALLGGEFELRTVKTLAKKLNKTEEFILQYVADDSYYVVKTRRSDGAKLIGLA